MPDERGPEGERCGGLGASARHHPMLCLFFSGAGVPLWPLSLQATPIPTRPSLMHRRTCDPGVCSVFLAMSGRLRRSWLRAASHSRSNAAAPSPGEGNKKRQTERQKDKKNSEYLRVKVRERKIGSIKIGNREEKRHQGFILEQIDIVVPRALPCLY